LAICGITNGDHSRSVATIAVVSGLLLNPNLLPGLFDNALCCLRACGACRVSGDKAFYTCRNPI
jgi:hypothetical protein